MMSIVSIIATFMGAFPITGLINEFFLWIIYKLICQKKIRKDIAAFPAFMLSVTFVFIVHKPHFEIDSTFIYIYLPCLIWWLIYAAHLKKLFEKDRNDEIKTGKD